MMLEKPDPTLLAEEFRDYWDAQLTPDVPPPSESLRIFTLHAFMAGAVTVIDNFFRRDQSDDEMIAIIAMMRAECIKHLTERLQAHPDP